MPGSSHELVDQRIAVADLTQARVDGQNLFVQVLQFLQQIVDDPSGLFALSCGRGFGPKHPRRLQALRAWGR